MYHQLRVERASVTRVVYGTAARTNSNEHEPGLGVDLREELRQVLKLATAGALEVKEGIYHKSAVHASVVSATLRPENLDPNFPATLVRNVLRHGT